MSRCLIVYLASWQLAYLVSEGYIIIKSVVFVLLIFFLIFGSPLLWSTTIFDPCLCLFLSWFEWSHSSWALKWRTITLMKWFTTVSINSFLRFDLLYETITGWIDWCVCMYVCVHLWCMYTLVHYDWLIDWVIKLTNQLFNWLIYKLIYQLVN